MSNDVSSEYPFPYPNQTTKFFIDVSAEYKCACEKFPGNKRLLGALVEEVGELAEALLKITESGEPPQNVYDEAVQVATMAMRLAIQGEPDYEYGGTRCANAGCKSPVQGGPCALCYE